MTIRYDEEQGSEQWLANRANPRRHNASEAPIMMGVSKHTSRAEGIRMKATGDVKTFSEWEQTNLLDKGIECEGAARALLKDILGEELYPVVHSDDDGYLFASYDGMTMDETTAFEHKMWSEERAEQIRSGKLAPLDYWQLEHQLAVTPTLLKIIFVISDGTPERFATLEYTAVRGRRERLMAGWKLWDEDLAAFANSEPQAIEGEHIPAQALSDLPAVFVEVKGELTLASNFAQAHTIIEQWIARVDTQPTTESGFETLKDAAKKLRAASERTKSEMDRALNSATQIEEMRRSGNQLAELCRLTAIAWEKTVEQRRKTLRTDMVRNASAAFRQHYDKLNERLGGAYMPEMAPDFAQALYRKSDLDRMKDAISGMLASEKLNANEHADRIEANVKTLDTFAKGYEFLFSDRRALLTKERDDLVNAIKLRIAEHKEAEEKRIEAAKLEESRRLQGKRLAAIHAEYEGCMHGSAAGVKLALDRLRELAIDDTYEGFREAAQTQKEQTISLLDQLLASKLAKEAEIAGQSAACETSAQKQSELTMIEQVGSALQESRDMSIQASLQLQKMGASALLMDASELIRTFLDTIMNALGGDHPAREDAEDWLMFYENFDRQLDQSS